jgi:acetyl esterase/lipase
MMTREDYARLPAIEPDYRLSYGAGPEQFGDLYLPDTDGPYPVVVLLHGGCWLKKWSLSQLGSLCRAFTSEDLAVWNLEYRRLGNGGGWPGTFHDVAAGVDFLVQIADAHPLDLSRVVVVGHSVGGHLALWLAGRHRLPAASELYSASPLPVKGVVSLAGIPDVAMAVEQDICRGTIQQALGGMPEEVPARYRHVSPIELLPLGVPQRHIHGLVDDIAPVDYVQLYVKVARQREDVRLDVIEDVGHFDLVVPATPAWPVVRQAVLEMVE